MKIVHVCGLAVLLFIPHLHAQLISAGIKGGALLTDTVEGYGPTNVAKRYTLGPMVEIRLPLSFAFEADALYRRTGYDALAGGLSTSSDIHLRANSWEFPLLAKYYFGPRVLPMRFYATGGYVVRNLSGFDISIHTVGIDLQTGNSLDSTFHLSSGRDYTRNNPVSGFVAGGGARFHFGHFAIAPEVRYTHWSSINLSESGSFGFNVQSTQNQADLLVGLTF